MYSKTMRTTGPDIQAVIERNVMFLYSQELMEFNLKKFQKSFKKQKKFKKVRLGLGVRVGVRG